MLPFAVFSSVVQPEPLIGSFCTVESDVVRKSVVSVRGAGSVVGGGVVVVGAAVGVAVVGTAVGVAVVGAAVGVAVVGAAVGVEVVGLDVELV
jgi:hypothetical protein